MAHLLILADTDGSQILPSTLPTITFAQEWARETGGTFDLLVLLGAEADSQDVIGDWGSYGARSIYVDTRAEWTHPVADQVGAFCASVMRACGASSLAGAASAFGRDVLPRVAGLLDLPMVPQVMQVQQTDGGLHCRRPMYAGQAIATVRLAACEAVFSVRSASYGKPQHAALPSPVVAAERGGALPTGTRWLGQENAPQTRPALTSARVIVAGGRPLRDAATFEGLVGGLADALGGAVGATGGAVGAEIAPSELLIGQTGKTVAPELYVGAGVSGSDQHVAGMRDSRVIVAINTDSQATLFGVADYGLVADIHQALPELIAKLARP